MKIIKTLFVLSFLVFLFGCAHYNAGYFGERVTAETTKNDDNGEPKDYLFIDFCCEGDKYSVSFAIPQEDKHENILLATQEEKWLPPDFTKNSLGNHDTTKITLPAPRCFVLTIKKDDIVESHIIHQQ